MTTAKAESLALTRVLAGLKAFFEHGVRLNLVADRYPEKIVG